VRRILTYVALVAFLGIVGWQIYRASLSDETRIRMLLDDCVDDFNARRVLSLMDGFTLDYEDSTSGTDRNRLQGALLYLFQRRIDKKTRRFRYQIVMPEDSVRIEVAEGEPRARADLGLELVEDDRRVSWKLDVHAELIESDGVWRIRKSSYETVAGERPIH